MGFSVSSVSAAIRGGAGVTGAGGAGGGTAAAAAGGKRVPRMATTGVDN